MKLAAEDIGRAINLRDVKKLSMSELSGKLEPSPATLYRRDRRRRTDRNATDLAVSRSAAPASPCHRVGPAHQPKEAP